MGDILEYIQHCFHSLHRTSSRLSRTCQMQQVRHFVFDHTWLPAITARLSLPGGGGEMKGGGDDSHCGQLPARNLLTSTIQHPNGFSVLSVPERTQVSRLMGVQCVQIRHDIIFSAGLSKVKFSDGSSPPQPTWGCLIPEALRTFHDHRPNSY